MSSKIEVSKLAKFCNMSPETIMRFIEADYIKVLERKDDKIFINANEACALFGVNPEKLQSELKEESNVNDDKSLNKEEVKEEVKEIKEEKTLNKTQEVEETILKSEETKVPETNNNDLYLKLTELQEELLKKQDLEIEDLKKQRNWLQNRVEILEQKLDREQLLLLSQTQIVNQLIKKKKMVSPIQKALAWLGVPTKDESTETQNNNNVVEMNKSSNKDAA